MKVISDSDVQLLIREYRSGDDYSDQETSMNRVGASSQQVV